LLDMPVNTVIQRAGDAEREFVVVVAGIISLEHRGLTTTMLCAGEAWGDPPRPPDAVRHTATARTRTHTTLLVYASHEYEALLARCPDVARQIERVRALEDRSRIVRCVPTGAAVGVPRASSDVAAAVGGHRHLSGASPLVS
jgi:hypothetical protein